MYDPDVECLYEDCKDRGPLMVIVGFDRRILLLRLCYEHWLLLNQIEPDNYVLCNN